MQKPRAGFTIVELLIVIVVIAILAAISIVAYNGIQARAKNSARIVAGDQWVRAFKLYQAQYSTMPPSLDAAAIGTKFCLGTGFPVGGGGVPRCQNVTGTDSNSPAESDNASLMNELSTVPGGIPTAAPIRSAITLMGPWVAKVSNNSIQIVIVLDSTVSVGADCGGGYIGQWTGSGVSSCNKTINY